ncbi:MAG: DEAD/DEAH box helicase, partial [Oligoflexia bacterium]|nr:DEAD/DEAH box helicase [Oligoflexia bacterium]
ALKAQGWRVEVSGKKLQIASNFDVGVKSGIDWFDVSIDGTFDGKSFDLPTLLREVRAGSKFIHLDDGSIGLLPEEWFNRLSVFERFGKLTADGQSLRLAKAQLSLIDALTANLPKVKLDKEFQKWRTKLKSFDGIKPVNAPTGFKGKLRNYQKAGLAWLEFQREFGFGGCLADDMGLGKTIQVLAFLQAQHLKTKGPMTGTTLIVVPKSLIHNWMQEAEKFTPKLKVLIYSGIDRFKLIEKFQNYQIIICTYGVLRQDIEALLTIEFDRVILDEAQNIKNSSSLSSKACRLLKAKQRLALTGTPVENHLGELWSLFEFLNPGLLGSSAVFQNLTKTSKNQDGALPSVLHKALSPFLLRRTKEEVLKELPPKTEQVIYCDLEKDQQQYYDELRMYYQSILKDKVDKVGFQKSKIHVLEALLRLRQTACHPGLVDKNKETLSSGKLNVLDEMVEEVLSEKNHKLLIFSQFTSLLSIVQKRMRQKGLVYEYLDGKTSDRAERVKRFREDPDCRIFLISLKAGGTGLNLTEADYVFILDPWWNPAVEAQAIDRTHRIGQTKPVFAYRLIARGTVEEKILQLQGKKKKLFEELFSPAQAGLKSLTAQDIEFLLQ